MLTWPSQFIYFYEGFWNCKSISGTLVTLGNWRQGMVAQDWTTTLQNPNYFLPQMSQSCNCQQGLCNKILMPVICGVWIPPHHQHQLICLCIWMLFVHIYKVQSQNTLCVNCKQICPKIVLNNKKGASMCIFPSSIDHKIVQLIITENLCYLCGIILPLFCSSKTWASRSSGSI